VENFLFAASGRQKKNLISKEAKMRRKKKLANVFLA
jgi:hypothetical protein